MSAVAQDITAAAPMQTGKPAKTWRLPAVDGMRAMACMMVFAIHTWEFSGKPALLIHLPWGTINAAGFVASFPAGVDLFMVLSGFCLFWPLCKSEEALQKWSCKEYAWRRVKRICPPYCVAIAYVILLPQLLVVMMRIAGIEFEGHPAQWQPNPPWWNILAHVTFTHTLFYRTWDGITGAFWSLGLEAQFYLVFPLVVYRFRKYRVGAIIGMIAASLIFRTVMGYVFIYHYDLTDRLHRLDAHNAMLTDAMTDVPRLINISFLGRWMQFACGMLAALATADFYRRQKVMNAWTGTGLLILAAGVYGLIFNGWVDALPLALQPFPTSDLLMGVLFSLSLFAVTSSRTPLRQLFEFKPIVFIGTISYSIFLIHQPTAWFFSELVRKKLYRHYELAAQGSAEHYALLCTVGLAAVLLVSYPFYLLFEKPFIAGSTKASGKPASVPPAAGPAVPEAAGTAA